LKTLVDDHQVNLSHLPEAVINTLRDKAGQVMAEIAAKDETAGRVYAAYQTFAGKVVGWTKVADHAYLTAHRKADGGIKF